jgi:hypothetical protein
VEFSPLEAILRTTVENFNNLIDWWFVKGRTDLLGAVYRLSDLIAAP